MLSSIFNNFKNGDKNVENTPNITLKLEPQSNDAIILRNGDIIDLLGIKLKVSIIKEPIKNISQPVDIWPNPKHENNILHELGINEAGSTIVNKQYTSGKSSFLEQSPLDMLDEYLNFDDDEFKKGELDYAKI